ncbi:MAG: hypothetical protein JOY99_05435 [Sphingomonadaceae bacterium]|nr:hypothetical protein [Sphingomonadaceae bacterium]
MKAIVFLGNWRQNTDWPVILASRANGSEVGMEALSEGTRMDASKNAILTRDKVTFRGFRPFRGPFGRRIG